MNLPVLPLFVPAEAIFYDFSATALESAPKFRRRRAFSVNQYAPAHAVYLAKKYLMKKHETTNKRCFFTLVDRRGQQHAYYATPAQAMNGRDGNPGVAGGVNLSTWMSRVGRARQRTGVARGTTRGRRSSPTARMARLIGQVGEVLERGFMTQGGFNRHDAQVVLSEFEELTGGMNEVLEGRERSPVAWADTIRW